MCARRTGRMVSAKNAVNSPGVVNIEDLKFIAPNLLMGIYSLVNVVLVAVGVFFHAWTGLWAVFLTSLFMSLMFLVLTIFALGLKGLGANTKNRRILGSWPSSAERFSPPLWV
jgi:hypothetical protein